MQPKLPVGISTFSTIRAEGYVSVDKTALALLTATQPRLKEHKIDEVPAFPPGYALNVWRNAALPFHHHGREM